jgi:branched-chain amino acid transport system permease protein
LTVAALCVALVGRFRSLIITSIAGLALGVATSLLIGYAPQGSTLLQGLAPSLPFFLLTALLLLGWSPISARRDAVDTQGARRMARTMPDPSLQPEVEDLGIASGAGLAATPGSGVSFAGVAPTVLKFAGLAGLLLIGMFAFSDYWTGIIGVGLAYSVIFLSFTVATGEGAVLCLGQAAFVAIGGFLAGRFVTAHGLPLWSSAVVAVIAAGLVGIVIGGIGSRLDQIGFTLVTLAFALFCQQFAFNIGIFVPPAGVPYPVVKLFGLTQARSNVLLGFVVFMIIAGIIGYLKRGRLGRAYAGLRGNPISSESLGVDVRDLRTAVFAVAAAIAGLGGVLLGIDEQQLGAPDVALAVGLVWVAVNVAFGVRGVQGAFLAGLAYSLIPAGLSFVPGTWPGKVAPVLFGLGAIGLAKEPRGFLPPLQEKIANGIRRRRHVLRVSAQIP